MFWFKSGVDVAMNIADVNVNTPNGALVPGVEQEIIVTFKLLNNNEPDLNNDVAGVDRATGDDINFNVTSYIVDVNLTAASDDDVINAYQLTTVTEQLTADLQTSLNSVESEDFTIEFTVHGGF